MEGLRIQLGCGFYQIIEGWENLDFVPNYRLKKLRFQVKRVLSALGLYRRPGWRDERRFFLTMRNHDITTGLPFESDSAECIYASHVLEHIERHEGAHVLRECHRVLKPGAVLRVVVPDLDLYARAYVERDQEFLARLKDEYENFRRHADDLTDALNEVFYWGGHRYMYDWPKLNEDGLTAGFRTVTRGACGVSEIPGLSDFEVPRVGDLHVEMVK